MEDGVWRDGVWGDGVQRGGMESVEGWMCVEGCVCV